MHMLYKRVNAEIKIMKIMKINTTNRKTSLVMLIIFAVMILPALFVKNPTFRDIFSFGVSYTRLVTFTGDNVIKINRRRFNLGWKHQRWVFLWLPIGGSTNGEYVLYNVKRRSLARDSVISHEKAKELAKRENISLPPIGSSPINPYSLWWGWIVMIPLLSVGGVISFKHYKYYDTE